jgi:hypothetical protein
MLQYNSILKQDYKTLSELSMFDLNLRHSCVNYVSTRDYKNKININNASYINSNLNEFCKKNDKFDKHLSFDIFGNFNRPYKDQIVTGLPVRNTFNSRVVNKAVCFTK